MGARLVTGDCRVVLPTLAEGSVQCVVTSPPYWGLRDYGVEGQLGLEPTPEEYVANLVAVFREVRRVLRDDGTLWLNLGDSYCTRSASREHGNRDVIANMDRGVPLPTWKEEKAAGRVRYSSTLAASGLKDKDLVGIPWRVAFALQADGWWLRSDIIWSKPACMPESVTDRPTKSHEYLFLLAKSDRYSYDAEAIREPAEMLPKTALRDEAEAVRMFGKGTTSSRLRMMGSAGTPENGRNKRTVWTINPEPYAEAHFATFPAALVQPCILAGCPVGGTVLDPFAGTGTVGEVATALGRHAVLIELNPAYVALAERRCAQGGLFVPAANGAEPDVDARQGCLF